MIAALKTWLAADAVTRRPLLADLAKRAGMPAGRSWDAIPDEDLVTLRREVRGTDGLSPAEFDLFTPF